MSRAAKNGVGLSECAQVCKRLIELESIEKFLPGDCKLEVSSPGITGS